MNRTVAFIAALLIGLLGGLALGWMVLPGDRAETPAADLRADYKADAVLMAAEAYRAEADVELAIQRLAFLGEEAPYPTAQKAYLEAQRLGYSNEDLEMMQTLVTALQGQLRGAP